jgi:CSLREA domain-containing protein
MNIGIEHFQQVSRSFLSTLITSTLLFSSVSLSRNASDNPNLAPSNSYSPAVAAPENTYVVNSTADAPDADPANSVCATAGGACTLRAAIMQANFTPAADNITLPSGLYLLTRVGNDDIALVGDLDITAPITITGAGADVTIVDGNGAVTGDRVFQMLSAALQVNLSGITIRNGSVPSLSGGGILYYNQSGGLSSILNLNNVVLEGNHAGTGAGLNALNVFVGLQNTTVRNNTTTDSGNGDGGGIFLASSTLTMRDSQVYNNSAVRGGGVALSFVPITRIEHSEIYSNTAIDTGGGIYNDPNSPLAIFNSNLHNNNAGSNGGAITIYKTLVISDTVLVANHAALKGGGIFSVPSSNYHQSISGSTFSHNTAQYGGAIAYDNPLSTNLIMTLVNSTLSGNSVSRDGAGIYATNNANIQLYNVTIANNVLSRLIGTFNPMRGGGVFFTDTSVITAQNTLIADNYYTNNSSIATPDDCYNTQTTNSLNSLGWNLVETTSNCLISGITFGNITGQDPHLGPLGLNFGATLTQALLSGSPAIDAGHQPSCTDGNSVAITTDQRGFARPGGTRCDIGAFEYYPVFSAFLPVVQR